MLIPRKRKWQQDKAWSDKFLPLIRQIVGPLLLVPAPLELDQREAADLMVLRAAGMTIACHVRHSKYYDRYHNEFAVRDKRDSGAETELAKFIKGFGDWLFYGFATTLETDFAVWRVIDLHAWRVHRIVNADKIRDGIMPNGDGTYLHWYDIRSFPPEPKLVVACSLTPPDDQPTLL